MTLPEIILPKIVLPFDIPVLLHPVMIHFLVALPVVILLLELINLMMKKKAVGGVSFFLLILTAMAAIGAYFAGLVDAKEAYPSLNEIAKSTLVEHKLLGTYLMLGSVVLLFLKLLAMTGNKVLKALYMFALIAFVVLVLKQAKMGAELVYVHGLNVQAVKTLDDKIFDLEDALEDATQKVLDLKKPILEVKIEAPIKSPETVNTPSPIVNDAIPEDVEISNEIKNKTIIPVQESIPSVESSSMIPPVEVIPIPQ